MGMLAKGAGLTVLACAIIASPGTPEAKQDAEDTGGFVAGTAWNGFSAAVTGAFKAITPDGGVTPPETTTETPPETKTETVADADGTG